MQKAWRLAGIELSRALAKRLQIDRTSKAGALCTEGGLEHRARLLLHRTANSARKVRSIEPLLLDRSTCGSATRHTFAHSGR